MATNHDLTLYNVCKFAKSVKRVRNSNIGMSGKTLLKLANGGAGENCVVTSHKKPRPIIAELHGAGGREP
jgi:hypothetical protein